MSKPEQQPIAIQTTVVRTQIYRDGTRITKIPSGFNRMSITVTEREDYTLHATYSQGHKEDK